MRTFGKSSKLDNVLYDVRGPVVDEAARMEEDGMEILKLNIGNPYPFGFSAPQEVILDMLSNVRTSQGYSDSKGIFSARKAIMQYAQLRGIPGVTINDIYTGNGVSELINLCMQALLDNGDEILIPAPDYPLPALRSLQRIYVLSRRGIMAVAYLSVSSRQSGAHHVQHDCPVVFRPGCRRTFRPWAFPAVLPVLRRGCSPVFLPAGVHGIF